MSIRDRTHRSAHTAKAVALAVVCAAVTIALAGAAAAPAAGAAERAQIAVLDRGATARSGPSDSSRRMEVVSATRPISGRPTVLPVIGRADDESGYTWLRVLLPGRPNSHTGWIPALAASPASTPFAIAIDLSKRRVSVSRNGGRARSFRAVVGARSTPTPTGRFFVEELVKLGGGASGAPFALALSARSNVLKQFAGGPGQIALHGTRNVGGTPGTAASHGCLRLPTPAIVWLAKHVHAGARVTIQR